MASESTHPVEGITTRAQLIVMRRKRYLAQAMELFEEHLEKPLRRKGLLADPEIRDGVATAKAAVRTKMGALETDAIEIMSLGDGAALNGFAIEITDRLHPEGAAGLSRGARG